MTERRNTAPKFLEAVKSFLGVKKKREVVSPDCATLEQKPADTFKPIFDKKLPVGQRSILDGNVKNQSYWHHSRRPWLMPGRKRPPMPL